MVAAIASQTLRNTDIQTASATLNERLRALANAHDILNKTRWTSASIREVVDNTIAAFPVERISVTGPALPINPKMALTLSLAVNELATNALKYGALNASDGTVEIQWSLEPSEEDDGKPRLIWRWREQGGPPVSPPTRRGFGRFLIERVFGTDFGGTVKIDYNPDGIECVLNAPAPQLPTAPY
jgi:two-component sensor histidine kinase